MVNRTTVSDNRRYTETSSGWVGSYISKVQTGADRSVPKQKKHRRYRLIKRYEVINGKRKLVFRQRLPIYDFAEKPKSQTREEHAYTLVLLQQRDVRGYFGTVAAYFPMLGGVLGNTPAGAAWYSGVPPLNANHQIKLVNKLKEKMSGSDFNASVFLGEGHKTLQMLGDTAKTLARSIRALKKGNLVLAAESLGVVQKSRQRRTGRQVGVNELSSRWLELQYGWMPLVKDAKAAAEQLGHRLNWPLTTTYRTSVKVPGDNGGISESNSAYAYTITHDAYRRRSLIARVSEPLSVPQLLGLQDPELVAWELLPYSFVFDWFVPVGDWLSARALVSKLHGTFITTDKLYAEVRDPVFSRGVTPSSSASYYRRVELSRSISSSLSVPMPVYKGWEKAASLLHCLNGLALLGQATGRIRPRENPWTHSSPFK
jgi:hypothetical protein